MSVLSRPLAVAAVVLVALTAPAGAAVAESSGDANPAFISAEGTGCPEGSVLGSLAQDRKALSVNFAAFELVGGESKDCRLRVAVRDVPEGYTYAVKQLGLNGGTKLAVGDSVELRYRISFADTEPGDLQIVTLDHSVNRIVGKGIADDSFEWRHDAVVADQDLLWAPCDGTSPDLVIDAGLRARGAETNQLTIDTIDVATGTATEPAGDGAHLVYKRC